MLSRTARIILTCITLLGAISASAAPAQRIGITTIAGKKTLYNTVTGAEFNPRGYNYTVVETRGTSDDCKERHITFDTGRYQAALAEAFLGQMQYDGYNTVRVMLDWGDACRAAVGQYAATPPSPVGSEVYSAYMANIVDFLLRAKAKNLYVILVMNYTPQSPYYQALIGGSPEPHAQIAGENRYLLTQGGHQAKAAYLTAFINALKNSTSPVGELLPTVLAYELQNEVMVVDNLPPFSLTSGTVTFGNGLSYNMASTADRQQAMDANVVQWSIVANNAVKQADPSALVSASVFTFAAVGLPGYNGITPVPSRGSEKRHPARVASLHQWSTIDFTDIHLYPVASVPLAGGGTTAYTQAADLASSEFSSLRLR